MWKLKITYTELRFSSRDTAFMPVSFPVH